MKKIMIDSTCKGCGLCIVHSKYFEEDDEGNAQVVRGMVLKSEDEDEIYNIMSVCPVRAISIKDTGVSTTNTKEGLKQIITDLRKKCQDLSVERPGIDAYKFSVKDYELPIPRSTKNYKFDYSSERAAKSAAEDEFRSKCYSNTATDPMIKKMFVEYKIRKLKPFYDNEDHPASYYFKYNEKVRSYLAEAYAEICNIMGDSFMDSNWKEFSCYISPRNNSYAEILSEFDDKSKEYDVISMIEKFSKDFYSPGIEGYMLNFEFESLEEYVGTGLFGSPKYKEKWSFIEFNTAAKEYIDDVYYHIDSVSDDIMDLAYQYIDGACYEFEHELKEKFNAKITKLENIAFRE